MKKSIILFLTFILSMGSNAATSSLLLDAACKLTCLVKTIEIEVDQYGTQYKKEYDSLYFNLIGLDRESLDHKIASYSDLDKMCQAKFNSHSTRENVDCLYFKH